MPYTPTVWNNDAAPAINATNLNKIESGVQTAQAAAEAAAVATRSPVATKTANYTLAFTDVLILADATGGPITMTLPTAVGVTGQQFVVKRMNTNANAVTIATTSSQTIDGASTYLPAVKESVPLTSDGANWVIA